jgi:hypothetical protein
LPIRCRRRRERCSKWTAIRQIRRPAAASCAIGRRRSTRSRERAWIRFFYDGFEDGRHNRFVSDFASHAYFPNELRLLFLHAGFTLDGVWADFSFRAPRCWSRELVMAGCRRG